MPPPHLFERVSEANPPSQPEDSVYAYIGTDRERSVVDQYRLVNDLLGRVPASARDHVFVVGGQALMFWSMKYAQAPSSPLVFSDEETQALTSVDLDFFARDKQSIEACADRWKGSASYPSPDDNTPQSAIVLLNLPGEAEPYKIDFMETLQGVPERHLEAYWDGFTIGGETLRFLSPPLCLASRIHNFASLSYGPAKEQREAIRIQSAIKITKAYLSELLDEHVLERKPGSPRHALNILAYLSELFCHDHGVDAALRADVDPTNSIPWAHMGWPEKTRTEHIPRLMAKAYDKYQRRARLRLRHLKPGQPATSGLVYWSSNPK